MRTALLIALVSWLLFRALLGLARLRTMWRRDRLAADFSRELRRRGLVRSIR